MTLANTIINGTTKVDQIVSGLIEAFDAAATVVLDGATINKAAFETPANGVITTAVGSNTTLNAVTIVAGTTVTVVDGSTLTLEGTTADMGSIAVGGVGVGATLDIAPASALLTTVNLVGGGSVVMSDNAGNLITDTGVAVTLNNSADIISGAGAIGTGDGKLTLVNNGTIDATGVNALTIDTGNAVKSTGTLEATGAGGLIVDDNVSGAGKGLIADASKIELAGTGVNTAAVSFLNGAGGDTGLFVLDHATSSNRLPWHDRRVLQRRHQQRHARPQGHQVRRQRDVVVQTNHE